MIRAHTTRVERRMDLVRRKMQANRSTNETHMEMIAGTLTEGVDDL